MKLPFFDFNNDSTRVPVKQTTVVSHHSDYTVGQTTGGLSVLLTILCIVDLFGVFPVITLPKSVISCGIFGTPLVLSVFGLQLYTAVLLGRCWLLAQQITPHIREKNRSPYAAVAELAFGLPAKRIITCLIDITVFGSGIPNFIIAAQTLQIFWWKISWGAVGVSYCLWMILLALLLCPVMWLGSPKDMKPIAISSVFIVTTIAVTTWTCITGDDVSPPPVDNILAVQPELQDYLTAYGILAFQFDIHPMLLTLQVDMKDSRKINTAVMGGFGITIFMFAITTILAGARYGTALDNNILKTLPSSIPQYVVALLVTLQLCLSSAVSHSALFQHIEDLLKISRDFNFQRCLIRSGILALAILLAEIVPRFDLVMGLIGSTLTGPLMFICPPLFFLKLCYLKSKMKAVNGQNNIHNVDSLEYHNGGDLSKLPLISEVPQTTYKTFDNNELKGEDYFIQWYDILLALVVITLGVVATLVATYTSWINAITYSWHSPPCLLNTTLAARAFIMDPAISL